MEKFEFTNEEFEKIKREVFLTPREFIILEMRRNGKSLTQISINLFLSKSTIGRSIRKISKRIKEHDL